MTDAQRPTTPPSAHSKGFWEAVSRGELVAQKCTNCNHLQHYPRPLCPECQSSDFSWQPLSGRGHIFSYTISYKAFDRFWADHVPYVIATIELEEGVRMVSDILDLDPGAVAINQKVEVYFEDSPGSGLIPRFRVVQN